MSQKEELQERALHALLDFISNLKVGDWWEGSTNVPERGEFSSAAASSKGKIKVADPDWEDIPFILFLSLPCPIDPSSFRSLGFLLTRWRALRLALLPLLLPLLCNPPAAEVVVLMAVVVTAMMAVVVTAVMAAVVVAMAAMVAVVAKVSNNHPLPWRTTRRPGLMERGTIAPQTIIFALWSAMLRMAPCKLLCTLVSFITWPLLFSMILKPPAILLPCHPLLCVMHTLLLLLLAILYNLSLRPLS
jgi:hypothetical protein